MEKVTWHSIFSILALSYSNFFATLCIPLLNTTQSEIHYTAFRKLLISGYYLAFPDYPEFIFQLTVYHSIFSTEMPVHVSTLHAFYLFRQLSVADIGQWNDTFGLIWNFEPLRHAVFHIPLFLPPFVAQLCVSVCPRRGLQPRREIVSVSANPVTV